MNRKRIESMFSSVASIALITSPLLLLAGGFEIAAFAYSQKLDALDRDGIKTTATVYKVTHDRVGEALQSNSEDLRRTVSSKKSRVRHWKLHYRFTTIGLEDVTGSFNVQSYGQPQLGENLEVRYLAADPSVHETAVGHTNSQASALHWIAIAFVSIWIGTGLVAGVKAILPQKMSTREKRLARKASLDARKPKQSPND
ncbi:MAG: hypothetical protein AAFN77_19115 [Planctomycetota bacterium]